MTDYILENHAGHSGIIYCLSKKDAEIVAVGVQEASNRRVRTGVYHADVGDGEKERLHRRWRKGEVQVVCATIGQRKAIVHQAFIECSFSVRFGD